MHFYESTLIDTTDNIQCKVYANSHPKGFVIVKPKYIPETLLDFTGLRKRFLFSQAVTRFNLFNKKEIVMKNLKVLKEKFPEFFYECPKHQNWFLVVPKEKLKGYHDPKKGLQELMKVPVKDLDPYLKATRELVELIMKAGVPLDKIGISHSTLLGNYTPGKSDIDILVSGKENGWKTVKFMEIVEHPKLKWKTKEDWAKYYKDRVVSKQFNEEEYVFNMVRKKDDGFFDGHVFSIFVLEEPEETWYDWEEEHQPLGTVKIQATVNDDYNSIVRPGFYGLSDSKIIEGYQEVPIKRLVTWSRPFILQAKKGEQIEACGLLEKIKSKDEDYYQLVIGYFDTYTSERGEKEYLKVLIKQNGTFL
ncbi:MAG: hypothetical protein KAT77_01890 [Nanoarchaeota archaeon]|nr:hypothetical protein [Nanoarchaeota archaeon]